MIWQHDITKLNLIANAYHWDALRVGALAPGQPVNGFHVAVHVPLGERPFAVPANNLLAFHQFDAPALVVDGLSSVANVAVLVVLAAFCMADVTPFAAVGTLQALVTVGLHQLPRSIRFAAVGARMLQSKIEKS